jgi:hypothetical protein
MSRPRQFFEGWVTAVSPKSVLFWGHYWGAPMWFPMSQIELQDDDSGHVLILSGWLAHKRGLSEFVQYSEEEAMRIANT